MSKTNVRYRRPLNNEQFRTLRLLYWYRFGTCKHITTYLHKSNTKVTQKKLQILEAQEYIAKIYDKSYKLRGRPAEYYVTPKGARMVRDKTDPEAVEVDRVVEQGIKNLYKLKDMSESFRDHCLHVLQVAAHLQNSNQDRLVALTRMRLFAFDYLPTWRPDLTLDLKTGVNDNAIHQFFFLDVWDDTKPLFVGVRKARSYLRHAGEEWPSEADTFPIVLMLCSTEKTEAKLRRHIRKALDESYEEIVFATTTITTLLLSTSNADKIWLPVTEDNEDDTTYTLPGLYTFLEQRDALIRLKLGRAVPKRV